MSFNLLDEKEFSQKNYSCDDCFNEILMDKEISSDGLFLDLFGEQNTYYITRYRNDEIEIKENISIESERGNEFDVVYIDNNFENKKNEEKITEPTDNKKECDEKKIKNQLGRKKKNYIMNKEEKILHTKNSKDNIIRKIKIHILLFITNLINDCIKKECNRQTYIIRGVCKEISSDITINNNIELFKQTMGEILSNPINQKYKNVNPDENEKQINRLREKSDKCPKTNELLNKTFEEVYQLFINGDKNQLKEQYGLNEAETLNDYLFKISNKENEEYIDELRVSARKYKEFFNVNNARKPRKNKKN